MRRHAEEPSWTNVCWGLNSCEIWHIWLMPRQSSYPIPQHVKLIYERFIILSIDRGIHNFQIYTFILSVYKNRFIFFKNSKGTWFFPHCPLLQRCGSLYKKSSILALVHLLKSPLCSDWSAHTGNSRHPSPCFHVFKFHVAALALWISPQ